MSLHYSVPCNLSLIAYFLASMFHTVVWQHMQVVVGFTANFPRNLPVEIGENQLRFDRIVAMSLWPHFFGPPCRLIEIDSGVGVKYKTLLSLTTQSSHLSLTPSSSSSHRALYVHVQCPLTLVTPAAVPDCWCYPTALDRLRLVVLLLKNLSSLKSWIEMLKS